jgi:GNAT superfamily N-acetyltransferase
MNKENIILNTAKTSDAEPIAALVNSVYRGENAKKGWTTEADILSGIRITPEKVKEIIERSTDVIINALIEDELIGCVHLENKGKFSLLGLLSVDVNYQSKGIGKILINECERYTKEVMGLDEIRMKVISIRSELIEYYKRRDYILTGKREDFVPGDDTFGETKQKLYFDILSKRL